MARNGRRIVIPALAAALFAGPAQAAGGLWCSAEDAMLKLDVKTAVTRGMGGPFFDFAAAAAVRAAGVADDFRTLDLGGSLVHSWLDGDEAKLSFYLERDRGASIAEIEIAIEADLVPDGEGEYAGSYSLVFFEPAGDGGDRRVEASGPVTCGAD